MRRYKRVINKKLGQILIESGIISREELDEAVQKQKSVGKLFGEVLVDLGYATEEEITAAISAQYGIPYITLDNYEIDPSIIRMMPEYLARKYRCIPLDRMADVLTLVIDNPLDEEAKMEIEEKTGLTIRCFTATSADILASINKYYRIKVPDHIDLDGAEAEVEEEKISTYTIKENGTIEGKL